MRNLKAILLGITTLFVFAIILTFVLINFDIEPFNKFATGNFDKALFFKLTKNIIILYILIIFPVISFITGVVSALVAKSREFFIGLISVSPLFILFFDFSSYYLLILLSVTISVAIGTKIALRIKKSKNQ